MNETLLNVAKLLVASNTGDLPAVRRLVGRHRVNVDSRHPEENCTPLIFASSEGYLEIVQCLVDNGANIKLTNNDGDSALMFAAQEGHLPVIQYLNGRGANINLTNNEGSTALILAAQDGHLPVVQYLLGRGANINHANDDGHTALMNASLLGHLPVVQYLHSRGAKFNQVNNDGHTALIWAAVGGNVQIVQYLVDNGANMSHVDKDGDTALHNACEHKKFDVALFLVKSGADANLRNKLGKTPLDNFPGITARQRKQLLQAESTTVTLEDFKFNIDPAQLLMERKPLSIGSTRLDNNGPGEVGGMIGVERTITSTHSLSFEESKKTMDSITKGSDKNVNGKLSIPYFKGVEVGGQKGRSTSASHGKEVEVTSSNGFEGSTSTTVKREITVTSAPYCDMEFEAIMLECSVNVPFTCSVVTRSANTGEIKTRVQVRGRYKGVQHSEINVKSKVIKSYNSPESFGDSTSIQLPPGTQSGRISPERLSGSQSAEPLIKESVPERKNKSKKKVSRRRRETKKGPGMPGRLLSGNHPPAKPSPWSVHNTPEGRKYWYNKETQESSWTEPEDPKVPTPPASRVRAPPGGMGGFLSGINVPPDIVTRLVADGIDWESLQFLDVDDLKEYGVARFKALAILKKINAAKAAFMGLDTDGSGSVSSSEFVVWAVKNQYVSNKEGATSLFSSIRGNDDDTSEVDVCDMLLWLAVDAEDVRRKANDNGAAAEKEKKRALYVGMPAFKLKAELFKKGVSAVGMSKDQMVAKLVG
eukprot:TRINITY_DN5107_c0_g3_i2.p1 TRINITY_DN5107_c0_g3~~TRINITY_DN5107_c0_g3_i2.p1  ORF type:complete len:761 (-),score=145.34 TRINITY_DN5107_c0_g3_i2:342-2624(-)